MRAPFCPYFLRSLPRESRVTMPSAFSFLAQLDIELHQGAGNAQLYRIGLAVHAAAETLAITLNVAAVSVESQRRLRRGALRLESQNILRTARPLTLNSPLPGRRYTRAIADLRRPVP